MEREEREARLRLAAARQRQLLDDGEDPPADHQLIRRLQADWKRALARLHRVRRHPKR